MSHQKETKKSSPHTPPAPPTPPKPPKPPKPEDYEDFITARPEPILFLNEEQQAVAKEHGEIIKAMIGKNLTAKEVHALYFNPSKEAYDKTIKTVYRHLEVLEKAGLVIECGHRKPHGSRLTEKLFCRSANIFVLGEGKPKDKWWKKEKGQKIIQRLSVLIPELFEVELKDFATFENLVEQYLEQHDSITMELWRKAPDNESISEIFREADLWEIKYLSGLVSTIGVMLRNTELCDDFKKLLGK
jgi:DNA-binding transcriptional ArsR family regulator